MAEVNDIAVIGLGIMGGATARNLVAARFRVSGFDLDAGKMAVLGRDGVRAAGAAADAARGAGL